MEQSGRSNVLSSYTESIGIGSETQGSETSQDLQEKKSTEIPQVVASERGSSLNQPVYRLGLRDFKRLK